VKDPDYVVLRAAADAPEGFLSPQMDGCWIDRSELPPPPPPDWKPPTDGSYAQATAVPTGRFEVRDWDGAVAEVYEVRP
jgi:hypothetical protein